MPFITESGLRKLDEYKYISGGYSWLDNKMNPFWVWFVDKLTPSWLAPNLMTTLGFFFMAMSYTIMLTYDFSLIHDVPSWTYFFAAICIFIYQTLDACDGKQARKTGSSSPLGQLVDHGCDSFAINFMFLSVIQAVSIPRLWILICYLNMQIVFWTSQWYENHTKILKTNVGNLGVTEAEFIIIAIHIVTGIYGKGIWSLSIKEISPNFLVNSLQNYESGRSLLNLQPYVPIYYAMNIAMVLITSAMVLSVLSSKPNKLYQLSQFIPVFVIVGLEILIYTVPALNMNYLGLVLISFGILFSLICSKIIVCSMTEMKFPLFHKEIVIPFLTSIYLFVNHKALDQNQIIFIFCLNIASIIITTLIFLHSAITEITDHLGIYCFTLRRRERKSKNQ